MTRTDKGNTPLLVSHPWCRINRDIGVVDRIPDSVTQNYLFTYVLTYLIYYLHPISTLDHFNSYLGIITVYSPQQVTSIYPKKERRGKDPGPCVVWPYWLPLENTTLGFPSFDYALRKSSQCVSPIQFSVSGDSCTFRANILRGLPKRLHP